MKQVGKPRLRRVSSVVNPLAGGVGPDAEDAIGRIIAEYGYDLSIFTPADGGVEGAVRSAVGGGADLVIILAGDGTARLAAELSGPDGPMIAPLPGGTMNMLPHALYGPRPWQETLRSALSDGVERRVGGGRVGGQAFFVAAVFGAPALWAYAREAVRAGDLKRAGRNVGFAMRRAFSGGLRFGLEDRPRRHAEALVLINPVVSRAVHDETALEAAALEIHGAQEVFRMAFFGLIGDWRRDPAVTVEACRKGWASARRPIPCILDGETQRLPRRVEFDYRPQAFRALAPPAV